MSAPRLRQHYCLEEKASLLCVPSVFRDCEGAIIPSVFRDCEGAIIPSVFRDCEGASVRASSNECTATASALLPVTVDAEIPALRAPVQSRHSAPTDSKIPGLTPSISQADLPPAAWAPS